MHLKSFFMFVFYKMANSILPEKMKLSEGSLYVNIINHEDLIRREAVQEKNNEKGKNGAGKTVPVWKLPGNIHVKIYRNTGRNNRILIYLPEKNNGRELHIKADFFNGEGNFICLYPGCSGRYDFYCHENGNRCVIGSNCDAVDILFSMFGNTVIIGDDCLAAKHMRILCDGHSVTDCKTGRLLNYPSSPVIIGPHTWIGERVTFTKNAQIAGYSIIGAASVVTKKFTVINTLIAGSPASVRKKDINWDKRTPQKYSGS